MPINGVEGIGGRGSFLKDFLGIKVLVFIDFPMGFIHGIGEGSSVLGLCVSGQEKQGVSADGN
jgi:hypothetical protein